jgi:two-component system LytT family response regulator
LTDAERNLPKRVLIVDDEPLARQRLARYVRAFDASLVIEAAESGLRAVELIGVFRPDVILLDIEMPGLNGFEVLQQCATRPFRVIFQTAYDQFAIRAFEECACDYLLKPFTATRLRQALTRAFDQQADEERLRLLEAQLAGRHGPLRRFTVKQGARLRLIEEQDVLCFLSQDHYTCVYFTDAQGRHEGIVDLSLTRLLERLDPAVFRQLHRNNIARLSAIIALERSRAGEWRAELSGGLKLPVARRQQAALRALLPRP